MIWLLLACAGQVDDSALDTCAPDQTLSWQSFGHGFFLTYCNGCHSVESEQRHGAPPEIDFDTYELLVAQQERVRIRVLERHDMPLGGGISEDELLMLERYLCSLEAP